MALLKRGKSNITCFVSGCNSRMGRERTLSYHLFPKIGQIDVTVTSHAGLRLEMDRHMAWKHVLQTEREISHYMRVCSRHFRTEDYIFPDIPTKKRRLKNTAVPSLCLPDIISKTDIVSKNAQTDNVLDANGMDMSKVCRTCLSASPTRKMKSLFEVCSKKDSLAEILMALTPLRCSGTDGLPAQICYICSAELSRFHTFQLKCLKSDDSLRKYMKTHVDVETDEDFNMEHNYLTTGQPIGNEKEIVPEFILIKSEIEDEANEPFLDIKIEQDISITSLNTPLTITEMEVDLNQELDLIKHETPEDNGLLSDSDSSVRLFRSTSKTKRKPYSCTICRETFQTIIYLTRHMRTHSEEKQKPPSITMNSFS